MPKNRVRYEKALEKGWAYNAARQWDKALGAFRIAIDEFPKAAAPYAGIGEACLGLKQLDRALECYKIATRYSGGNMAYLQKVADIQERMGHLTEAGRTYMAIGEIALRRRQLDEAIDNWERSARLEPSLLGAHRRLAMVFQRQGKTREAVREYLAIARILQMQGEKRKALQMCQAALRLDPDNQDVLKAVELIRLGAEGFAEEADEEEVVGEQPAESDGVAETVRQMAAIFEAEKQSPPPAREPLNVGPVESARRLAQDQLAEEIFREESEEDEETGLSKLERDALIGQGMDFEARGQINEAIACYRKAIAGGLKLSSAYFVLGLLYLEKGQLDEAQAALTVAARDPAFAEAGRALTSGEQ